MKQPRTKEGHLLPTWIVLFIPAEDVLIAHLGFWYRVPRAAYCVALLSPLETGGSIFGGFVMSMSLVVLEIKLSSSQTPDKHFTPEPHVEPIDLSSNP